MVRLILADDHALFRTAVRALLDQRKDLVVLAEAGTGEEAIELAEQHKPELILMDVNMPGVGGAEATRRILRRHPDIKIIVITALSQDPFPSQLLDAGAVGYLTKGCPAEELFGAIDSVMAGQHYLSGEIAQKLALSNITKGEQNSPLKKLSPREMQVFTMIISGQSNAEISDSLFLSPKTISTYRHRLYEKLEVSNDVELTHLAVRFNALEIT